MKISLTLDGKIHSVECESQVWSDTLNVEEVAERFKGLLVSAGFHPSNVDAIFNTEYQWFTEEEIKENTQGHLPKVWGDDGTIL